MDDDIRASKLNKLFNDVLHGTPLNKFNFSRFLEAISIQPDVAQCVNKIIASPTGLASVQSAMRFDLSDAFLNGPGATTIAYLQAPELENISDGGFLRQIVEHIIDPPIFWDAFTVAFKAGRLTARGTQSFAWLLLQSCRFLGSAADPYLELASSESVLTALTASPDSDTRFLGHKIKHVVETCKTVTSLDAAGTLPGGRHDNDFADFRKISILPTADEVASPDAPFLRRRDNHATSEVETTSVISQCLDDHFRLLREDMLYEIKDELDIAFKKKKGHHRGLVVEGFTLLDEIYHGSDNRACRWGITLRAENDVWFLRNAKNRKKYLDDHRNYLKHQAYTCLLVDNELCAFPTIYRDEDRLAEKPPKGPVVILQLEGEASLIKTLVKLKQNKKPQIKLIQIDTAIFSYEPVLRALQEMRDMPLADELLCWSPNSTLEPPSYPESTTRITTITARPKSASPTAIAEAIRSNPRQDLSALLNTPKSIVLDDSQASSLIAGLTQRVSLIQGPPGTGKSFIGALLAKVLHDSKRTILVVCYTNHALDQFLEDILDIGVPSSSIVRLGGKSTPRTEPLSLYKQRGGATLGRGDWQTIDSLKQTSRQLLVRLEKNWTRYSKSSSDLLTYLEFEDSEAAFYAALTIPPSANGMTRVGKGGKKVDRWYLLNRWTAGEDAGIFKADPQIVEGAEVWQMDRRSRQAKASEWRVAFRKDQASEIAKIGKAYNACQDQLDRIFGERERSILSSKQIIGCTTTAAAKYTQDIQAASPQVLIVEEAGEILESHVITALGRGTKQLILIGDHKQLRPKVNNYMLTIEKGEGFDLNRSLFERLVLEGYPHKVLTQQHRMRPEISALVRSLTYPDLVDANSTKNRPNLRGVRDNLVFIDHDKPEDENSRIKNQAEGGSKSSKRNTHEAKMVMKIVKYLGQQGYGTDKLVVLTPYLGQLQELQTVLAEENDPVLNDLDSHDLISAGLLPAASANISKGQLRLATIGEYFTALRILVVLIRRRTDNYQGEESEIVISCLTRSNSSHDIGFMFSPERLNVLLSRPRNAFIMIGNSNTFLNSRKGKELWTRFFGLLRNGGHVYDGLPVKCERHPDRTVVLKAPMDFDLECPDGGCKEPCGTVLNCGVHSCPSKCHQISDHSKMECNHIMQSKCPKGHPQSWMCCKGIPVTCGKCEHEARRAEEKRKKEFELQQKRDAAQLEYAQKLAAIDAEIAARNLEAQDARIESERSQVIRQKEKDLEEAKTRLTRAPGVGAPPVPPKSPRLSNPIAAIPPNPTHEPSATASPVDRHRDSQSPPRHSEGSGRSNVLEIPVSPSRDIWQRQKDLEGADNEAIDEIMEMIGLEEVKSQVLDIKAKIDTAVRQNASLKDERFNITFLGNPGTGKTTVGRIYAKFLSSVGILPGKEFVETTGSRLSNIGVPGVQKMLEDLLKAGGGTIFVDEAYQLTAPQNYKGPEVLDFLLAEMENNVGTAVFIFAGYEKEMETFFEHNPGLTSRVPYQLKFADYTDAQLLGMLDQLVQKTFSGNMKVEDGIGGLYARIAVRRLGRGRSHPGFGNARALHNMFAKIKTRQAARIARQRREGSRPDDFLFTGEDLIGPDPSKASQQSAAWTKLQRLIGLTSVKASVQSILSMIETNYQRELQEKEPLQMSFNHVFFGSPGTGKTTVAKLYGQILADLFLISKGEVVVKNPADFIGNVLGASESNTKAILANTVGKVLVIDEAYMLYGGGSTGSQNDPYKTAVIDTIVAEIQSVPGEDRCVLMLGYEEQMMEMFQNVNPGLSRRFDIESAFRFEDFNDSELRDILDLKLGNQHLDATLAAKDVAIEVLSRARNRPNFGNAGEVENLLGLAKKSYQARQDSLPRQSRSFDVIFEPQDFDPEFDRSIHASTNLAKLFEDVVGCEEVISKLAEYQETAHTAKLRGMDVRDLIPTNWVFKGPPGTGKTTVARKMGQVYYDMGFLSSPKVEECSASDLVGQYVGQTGPKTTKLFGKALGRVLFIDEAYRLGEGQFAKEAIDELVGILTQPKYQSKIVVILAGYDAEMNDLLAVNTGLSSRFSETLVFANMSAEKCLQVLKRELEKGNVHLDDSGSKDVIDVVEEMSRLSSWGNARDMKTISKKMIGIALRSSNAGDKNLALNKKDALDCLKAHLEGLQSRIVTTPAPSSRPNTLDMAQLFNAPSAPMTSFSTKSATNFGAPVHEAQEAEAERPSGRDAGVSDAVWLQLQADIKAAEVEKKQRAEAIEQSENELREAEATEKERIAEVARLEAQARDQKEMEEVKRKLEEIRLQELLARQERERIARELEAQRKAEALERQKEAKAQAALRRMGVCVAGFPWHRQGGGYRCGGGTHFVSSAQLGME
ncbi:P-loop containing nucleoside triphosphate hydrolase protein [Mycena alexandri]|uniref:P-loop containing nucleoside triphosphate hydrolase protein n=1 Tax=Mycena alexandri TaxID=1745969 RepID=A0AAD6T0A6_9AGAR|nr:P-loop containing nucleoside triphosphate hydrolase protein [Mycena alexandri]